MAQEQIYKDTYFMELAEDAAGEAIARNEEPFGAVLVKGDEVVCTASHAVFERGDNTAHAIMEIIRKMAAKGVMNLSDYTLYCTCEPCFMCAGALSLVRIGRIVYGATYKDRELMIGRMDTEYNCEMDVFDHLTYKPEITGKVLRQNCIMKMRCSYGCCC